MCILLRLVLLGVCVRGEKVVDKWNNKSSKTILWAVPHPGPLVWQVLESYHFFISLEYSTISAQCRLYLWRQSEAFSTSTIPSWVFTIPYSLVPTIFVGLSLTLIFFIPFTMLVVWMVHVNSIKFPFRPVLGAPIPIMAISGNLVLWFIDYPGFNIVNYLSIELFGVPSFILGLGLGSVTFFYFNYCKDFFFKSNLY